MLDHRVFFLRVDDLITYATNQIDTDIPKTWALLSDWMSSRQVFLCSTLQRAQLMARLPDAVTQQAAGFVDWNGREVWFHDQRIWITQERSRQTMFAVMSGLFDRTTCCVIDLVGPERRDSTGQPIRLWTLPPGSMEGLDTQYFRCRSLPALHDLLASFTDNARSASTGPADILASLEANRGSDSL